MYSSQDGFKIQSSMHLDKKLIKTRDGSMSPRFDTSTVEIMIKY